MTARELRERAEAACAAAVFRRVAVLGGWPRAVAARGDRADDCGPSPPGDACAGCGRPAGRRYAGWSGPVVALCAPCADLRDWREVEAASALADLRR